MNKYPTGKGYFIWNLPNCAGGDPEALADMAVEAGLDYVVIKCCDGVAYFWEQYLGPAVRSLKRADIRVWFWFYTYGRDRLGRSQSKYEAQKVIDMVRVHDPDGLVVDAEAEYKKRGMDREAEILMVTLRGSLPDIPIGLSSFRYPSLHPEFCWSAFLKYSDFHMPQVYWEMSHNPGEQLTKSVIELRNLRSLPIIPAGSAYWRGSKYDPVWVATVQDLHEFDNIAKVLELPGVNYWSWEHAESYKDGEMWNEIATHQWDGGTVPPEPEPPEPEPPEPEDEIGLVDVYALNARTSPVYYADNRNLAMTLREGVKVIIKDKSGDWLLVEIGDKVWVHGDYIKKI